MATYNFNALNDKDFEELSRDLLQRKLGIFLESFKKGKDKGVDLKYSSNGNDNTVIVQAKHMLNSGFNKLFSILKNEEFDKVKNLAPRRYILTTTIALNKLEKDKIFDLFQGYIKNTEDIIGQDDLNNLLEIYPEIQKAYSKLYLGSLTVLNEIINHHIKSRSEFQIRKIQKTVPLYVINKKYLEAINILNNEHFLIITGVPGIGKTSLADFITYQHLADGFTFTYILSNLSDAEKMLDDEEKRIFYFDDFLGANYLKAKHDPHQDKEMLNFINRIKNLKNKRLVLTTRTTILNQAINDYERLKSPELDIAKYEIHINDYELYDKAMILYNHLFFSEMPVEFIYSIIINKTYLKIIEHPNYSPRIIQYMTDNMRLSNVNSKDYHSYILDKLDYPEDIWKDPYESQIDDASKFLLQTMFTLPFGTNEKLVLEAFNERVNYEVRVNGFQKTSNLFQKTVKTLLGGFLHRSMSKTGAFLEFYNPSFADFMSSFLNNNIDEISRILSGIIFTNQFSNSFIKEEEPGYEWLEGINSFEFQRLLRSINIEKVRVSKELLLNKSLERIDFLKPFHQEKCRELNICSFLLKTFRNLNDIESVLLEIYPFINFDSIAVSQFEELFDLTDIFLNKDTKIYELALKDWDKIVIVLFKIVDDENDFIRIKDLFDDTSFHYDDFLILHKDELQAIINSFWGASAIQDKISNSDFTDILTENAMLTQLNEIEAEVVAINEKLGLAKSPEFSKLYDWDYAEVISENTDSDSDDEYVVQPVAVNNSIEQRLNEIKKIENIFNDLLTLKSVMGKE